MRCLEYYSLYISTIPEHNSLMSIIGEDDENSAWFLNYFIQLMVNRNTEYSLDLNFCYGDNYNLIKNVPILDTYSIPRDVVAMYGDIVSFAKNVINKGYYVYLSVDVYEIEAYGNWYNGMHMNHDLMVIGYEEDFYVADFFEMKYSVKKCSKEQLNAGYMAYDKNRGNSGFSEIYILRKKEQFNYTFNVDFAKMLVLEYLNGINSCNHFHPVKNMSILNDELYAFGLNIYPVLKEYINNVGAGELIARSFHILCEHKKIMIRMMEHLYDIGCLKNAEENLLCMKQIYDESKLLNIMVMKYNIKKNPKVKLYASETGNNCTNGTCTGAGNGCTNKTTC